MELPNCTSTGGFAVVQGVGGGFETMFLYRVHLRSELVSGFVNMAEVQTLPFDFTDLVMGTDVAGTRVTPETSETCTRAQETRGRVS